jgi:hypothetical protein
MVTILYLADLSTPPGMILGVCFPGREGNGGFLRGRRRNIGEGKWKQVEVD